MVASTSTGIRPWTSQVALCVLAALIAWITLVAAAGVLGSRDKEPPREYDVCGGFSEVSVERDRMPAARARLELRLFYEALYRRQGLPAGLATRELEALEKWIGYERLALVYARAH